MELSVGSIRDLIGTHSEPCIHSQSVEFLGQSKNNLDPFCREYLKAVKENEAITSFDISVLFLFLSWGALSQEEISEFVLNYCSHSNSEPSFKESLWAIFSDWYDKGISGRVIACILQDLLLILFEKKELMCSRHRLYDIIKYQLKQFLKCLPGKEHTHLLTHLLRNISSYEQYSNPVPCLSASLLNEFSDISIQSTVIHIDDILLLLRDLNRLDSKATYHSHVLSNMLLKSYQSQPNQRKLIHSFIVSCLSSYYPLDQSLGMVISAHLYPVMEVHERMSVLQQAATTLPTINSTYSVTLHQSFYSLISHNNTLIQHEEKQRVVTYLLESINPIIVNTPSIRDLGISVASLFPIRFNVQSITSIASIGQLDTILIAFKCLMMLLKDKICDSLISTQEDFLVVKAASVEDLGHLPTTFSAIFVTLSNVFFSMLEGTTMFPVLFPEIHGWLRQVIEKTDEDISAMIRYPMVMESIQLSLRTELTGFEEISRQLHVAMNNQLDSVLNFKLELFQKEDQILLSHLSTLQETTAFICLIRDPNIRSKNTTIFHNKFMNDTILMDQWLVSPLSYLQWLGSFNMLPNLLRFAENGVRTYAILRKLTGTQRLGGQLQEANIESLINKAEFIYLALGHIYAVFISILTGSILIPSNIDKISSFFHSERGDTKTLVQSLTSQLQESESEDIDFILTQLLLSVYPEDHMGLFKIVYRKIIAGVNYPTAIHDINLNSLFSSFLFSEYPRYTGIQGILSTLLNLDAPSVTPLFLRSCVHTIEMLVLTEGRSIHNTEEGLQMVHLFDYYSITKEVTPFIHYLFDRLLVLLKAKQATNKRTDAKTILEFLDLTSELIETVTIYLSAEVANCPSSSFFIPLATKWMNGWTTQFQSWMMELIDDVHSKELFCSSYQVSLSILELSQDCARMNLSKDITRLLVLTLSHLDWIEGESTSRLIPLEAYLLDQRGMLTTSKKKKTRKLQITERDGQKTKLKQWIEEDYIKLQHILN